MTERIAPHWRGDLLLVLAGVAFASYTLIGRDVLARAAPLGVTAWSIFWGAVTIAPLAIVEWIDGRRPTPTPLGVGATLYVGLVISGLGYLVWNRAIQRVAAPRAAVFLTIQPIVGALLGIVLLGDPLTSLTLAGGALIVLGLAITVGRTGDVVSVIERTRPDGILKTCPTPAATSSRTTSPTA